MKSRYSTGIFIAIVLTVVGYAYFIEYKGGIKKEEQKEAEKLVLNLDKTKIRAFSVKNSKGQYELDKSSGDWQVKKPEENIADPSAIDSLLHQLTTEKFEDIVAEGDNLDLEIYGITADSNKIEIQSENNKKTVYVGSETSVGNKKYIKIEDENRVLLVGTAWEYLLEKDYKELVNKDILLEKDNIQNIQITNKHGSFNIHFSDNKWNLVELKTDDGKQSDIDQIHNNLRALRAQKYFSGEAKDRVALGLDKPTYKIQVTYKDGKKVDIVFSSFNSNKDAYVASSDRRGIYLVNEYSAGFITKSMNDFRDKERPFKFNKDDVYELSYRSSLTRLHVKKEEDVWSSIEENESKKVDVNNLSDLLNRIMGLRTKTFFDREVVVSQSGMNELKLRSKDGQDLLVLSWPARPLGDLFVVSSSLEKYPVGVDIKDISSLPFQSILVENSPEKETEAKSEWK